MKKSRIWTIWLALLVTSVGWAETPDSPLGYLNAMTAAHKNLNYEQFYLLQQGENVETWRYRHAQDNGKEFAQQLSLDGVRAEIILQEDQVGYFGDFHPFSLPTNRILDNLPAVIYTDFSQLSGYSFLDLGRGRVANRVSRIIRVVPNDEFRYQYTLWIDEKTHLLLKSELLDRDKTVLEQYRVVQSIVDPEVQHIVEPISKLHLPEQVSTQVKPNSSPRWQPKWLPKGFKAIASQGQQNDILPNHQQLESQLYSDGLFSFTIYQVKGGETLFDEHFWRDGKTTIYSQPMGDKEFVLIGEIPVLSAQHILQKIEQNAPLAGENRNDD